MGSANLEQRLSDVESHVHRDLSGDDVPGESDLRTLVPPYDGSASLVTPTHTRDLQSSYDPSPDLSSEMTIPNDPSVGPEDLCDTDCLICINIWFDRYHHFCPILHRETLQRSLQSSVLHGPYETVVRAIVAVTAHHVESLEVPTDRRQQILGNNETLIVVKCVKTPSLQSVQALLILSLLRYGQGRLAECWNLLAVARR
jgi:hypothetical protein